MSGLQELLAIMIGAFLFHSFLTFTACLTKNSDSIERILTFRGFLTTIFMTLSIFGAVRIGYLIVAPKDIAIKGDACLSCWGNNNTEVSKECTKNGN